MKRLLLALAAVVLLASVSKACPQLAQVSVQCPTQQIAQVESFQAAPACAVAVQPVYLRSFAVQSYAQSFAVQQSYGFGFGINRFAGVGGIGYGARLGFGRVGVRGIGVRRLSVVNVRIGGGRGIGVGVRRGGAILGNRGLGRGLAIAGRSVRRR